MSGRHRTDGEQPRGLSRTRIVVAGAASVGILAIATAGVAAVQHVRSAEPPTIRPVNAPSPTGTPSANLERYATDQRSSRSMQMRPSPSPSPSGSPSSSSGSGSSDSPVTSGKTCKASYYGVGQSTASGEDFDPSAYTAAHKTLSFGTRVKVTNIANDRTVTVRINDRGPFIAGRCLDLTTAAFKRIASTSSGVATVRYQVL